MNRDEARRYILNRSREYLADECGEDRAKKGFICPICGSGTGRNGTGITTKDGVHFTCWAGCFSNIDIFQIVGITHSLFSYNEQFEYLSHYFNTEDLQSPELEPLPAAEELQSPEPLPDYTEFYKKCAAAITKTTYHRGLSAHTLRRFKIGYCEDWQSPKALKDGKNPPKSRRLIIPINAHSYIARATDESTPKAYKKIREGKTALFNAEALRASDRPIFLLEGEIDALSVIECGGAAVGLGGLNARILENALKEYGAPRRPLLITLDNDPEPETAAKVQAAAEKVKAAAERSGVKAIIIQEDWRGYKDANELLQADPGALREIVAYYTELFNEKTSVISSIADDFDSLLQEIHDTALYKPEPTGFYELDNILDGGLYPALYCVGAISSLGKTTFVLQIADKIAESGRNVVIFSLEMSKIQLFSRSISRKTYEINPETAKTSNGIRNPERYRFYTDNEKAAIKQAIQAYKEKTAPRVYIVESESGTSAEGILNTIQAFTRERPGERPPVVVVDYLQILQSEDNRLSDKQKTDRDITALKRLTRQIKTPVIAISSLNRSNYSQKISLEAFKESGGIEYGCDVIIGLQLRGVGAKDFDVNTEKRREPRQIDALILKNRDYITGEKVLFDYRAKYNYFAEHTAAGSSDFSPVKI